MILSGDNFAKGGKGSDPRKKSIEYKINSMSISSE
jgi:hypothetical protein